MVTESFSSHLGAVSLDKQDDGVQQFSNKPAYIETAINAGHVVEWSMSKRKIVLEESSPGMVALLLKVILLIVLILQHNALVRKVVVFGLIRRKLGWLEMFPVNVNLSFTILCFMILKGGLNWEPQMYVH